MNYKRILILITAGIILCAVFHFSKWGFLSSKPFLNMKIENKLMAELKAHVVKLSKEIPEEQSGSKKGKGPSNRSAEYIKSELKKTGYTPETQEYLIGSENFNNIIAQKKGDSNKLLVIGAHYDTYFNPGADDNMSGVAVLLETAKACAKITTTETIVFVAFVNEEPPNFHTENMGSYVYAKSLRNKNSELAGAIILESVGYYTNIKDSQTYPPLFGFFYPNKGDFLALVSNFSSRKLSSRVNRAFNGSTSLPFSRTITFDFVPGVDFSDNWSFWKLNYPAVLLTDTAFFRNPNYHKQSDTYNTLDYQKMAEIVKALTFILK